MAKYDVLDEAVLEATPTEVATALENETHGRSHWWRSWMQIRPLDASRNLEVGATMRFAVHNPTSRVQWGLPRFTGRVTTYEPEHRIVFEFIEGAFRGTGEWVIERADDSHTRISFRWVASPAGSMRLKAHLVDVPKMHSRVMRKGYKGLDRYLTETRHGSTAA
jgi:uncharacterized protein YndB with AHSA1/START domain